MSCPIQRWSPGIFHSLSRWAILRFLITAYMDAAFLIKCSLPPIYLRRISLYMGGSCSTCSLVASTRGTPRARVSRVPFELLLDHLSNASDRRDPGAEARSLGFLKVDRPIDEWSQADSIEECLRTAWERHPGICLIHEHTAL